MFGGTYPYLKLVVSMLDVLAKRTMEDGLLGNDEPLLAILFARFPSLVRCRHYRLRLISSVSLTIMLFL